MDIYHYPVRSTTQFQRKVEQGGAAFQNHQFLEKLTGWHWRRWYRMIREQGIQGPLADALPSQAALSSDLATGRVLRDTRARNILKQADLNAARPWGGS
jgi:hypothetical protein